MLAALKSIFAAPAYQHEAHQLYLRIVESARQPVFYTDYAVPDTLDGRFDMIALHMFLVTHRLKKENTPEALEFLRAVSEVFFADMDRSLREMGASDTGVGKRIKNMSQAFYGRQLAYQTAGDDEAKMAEALLRNLYRGDIEKRMVAAKMAEYVKAQIHAFANITVAEMLAGTIPAQGAS